jgi:hypothetical protein
MPIVRLEDKRMSLSFALISPHQKPGGRLLAPLAIGPCHLLKPKSVTNPHALLSVAKALLYSTVVFTVLFTTALLQPNLLAASRSHARLLTFCELIDF